MAETKLDLIAWRDRDPFMCWVRGTSAVQDMLEEPAASCTAAGDTDVTDPAAETGRADLPCTKQHLSYHITQVAGPAHEQAKSPAHRPDLCEPLVHSGTIMGLYFVFPPWTSNTMLS